MAKDINVKLENNTLTISLPFDQVGKNSTTGKTLIRATSGGNYETDILVDGKPLVIGVNAYTKK